MKLCPVDLAACDRAECRSGHCVQANATHLAVCWECGELHEHGRPHGVCVACISSFTRTAVPNER